MLYLFHISIYIYIYRYMYICIYVYIYIYIYMGSRHNTCLKVILENVHLTGGRKQSSKWSTMVRTQTVKSKFKLARQYNYFGMYGVMVE